MEGLLESLSYRLLKRSCLPESDICGEIWQKCRVNSKQYKGGTLLAKRAECSCPWRRISSACLWSTKEASVMWPELQGKGEEARKGSTQNFRGSMALSAPWFQTFILMNYETIHFCFVQPPSLWHLATTVLGNWNYCTFWSVCSVF